MQLFQKQPFADLLKKLGVLKNFTIFIGKYLCLSLFLIKLQTLETLAPVFSCEYCKSFKSSFFHGTLLVAASAFLKTLAKTSRKATASNPFIGKVVQALANIYTKKNSVVTLCL